jgi:hypothetical protein
MSILVKHYESRDYSSVDKLSKKIVRNGDTKNLSHLVDDRRVVSSIKKLEPYFEYRRVPDLLHALELWGAFTDFQGPAPFSAPEGLKPIQSDEMVRFLLDEKQYHRRYLNVRLIEESPFGLTVRVGQDPWLSPHVDNLLSVFGEIGFSLDSEIEIGDKKYQASQLLSDATARFDPAQEIEFTTVAFCHYLPPGKEWSDRFGRKHDFNELASILVDRKLGSGCCYGTHMMYAAAKLLIADQKSTLISSSARIKLHSYLKDIVKLLESSQSIDGSWDKNWSGESTSRLTEEKVLEKLRATSHHLEWLLLVDGMIQFDRERAKRAAHFLLQKLEQWDQSKLSLGAHYTVLAHVGRSLCWACGKSNAWELLKSDKRSDPEFHEVSMRNHSINQEQVR